MPTPCRLPVLAFVLVAGALPAGCARQPPLPPPPGGVARVAIATPENRTGRELVVRGEQPLERLLGVPRVAVPATLEGELRRVLAARGFAVGGRDADVLSVRITRWEPEIPTTDFVTVSLVARLSARDGATRWEATRTNWLVATRGASSVGEAYAAAARAVAETLLAGWAPAGR